MRNLAWTLVLVLGLVVGPGSAGAAPPPASTLSSATGTEGLTFTWNVAAGATWYYLWVNDDDAAPKFTRWYTAEEVGCAGAGTLCSVTVALNWRPGAGRWWIRSNNADGNGPWSAAQNFTIPQRRPARVVDSSVPAQEVGILLDRGWALRPINGVMTVVLLRAAGFVFQDDQFYYTTADCSGTAYRNGSFYPQHLVLLGPTLNANAYIMNTDYQSRNFNSTRSFVSGVAQTCVADAVSAFSVSATPVSVGSQLSGFVPPFVVLP